MLLEEVRIGGAYRHGPEKLAGQEEKDGHEGQLSQL